MKTCTTYTFAIVPIPISKNNFMKFKIGLMSPVFLQEDNEHIPAFLLVRFLNRKIGRIRSLKDSKIFCGC